MKTGLNAALLSILLTTACSTLPVDSGDTTTGISNSESLKALAFGALNSVVIWPNGSIEMQRAIMDLQLQGIYFRDLKRRILYTANSLATELSLTSAQLTEVRRLLDNIEEQEKVLTMQRIEIMCEAWRSSDKSLTALERADQALALYKRLELSDPIKNTARRQFFTDLEQKIGSEASNKIRQNMASFAESSTMIPANWADMVRTIGLEVDQVEFTCSQ